MRRRETVNPKIVHIADRAAWQAKDALHAQRVTSGPKRAHGRTWSEIWPICDHGRPANGECADCDDLDAASGVGLWRPIVLGLAGWIVICAAIVLIRQLF